jgi:hypothetical protein
MLSGLSKRTRLRAALWLAALYAFCILAPHAALALTHAAAHCLTQPKAAAHVHQQKPAPAEHVHADGKAHTHANVADRQHDDGTTHDQSGKDSAQCCGVFCISAVAGGTPDAIVTPVLAGRTVPGLVNALDGRAPDRIIRPPIG